MEETLGKIKLAIIEPLKKMDIIVDSVKFVKKGNMKFLQIYLDKINGIDLDNIVAATEIINPIIDKLNPIEESYILDVLSKERGQ